MDDEYDIAVWGAGKEQRFAMPAGRENLAVSENCDTLYYRCTGSPPSPTRRATCSYPCLSPDRRRVSLSDGWLAGWYLCLCLFVGGWLQAKLKARFPKEGRGIDGYFAAIDAHQVWKIYRHLPMSDRPAVGPKF
jgi:hypothetical protein